MPNQQYQKCIDVCLECATICNHCDVSCLEEMEGQNLTKCIRLDLECAVICRASAISGTRVPYATVTTN